jgi:transposase
MLKMEEVHVVRHKYYNENRSIRQIALEMGLNWRTAKKYLGQAAPRREEKQARSRPVWDKVGQRIEALLQEWANRIAGKHRITSPRVHRQLLMEGVKIGERTVRRYLAERRRSGLEVYIPLIHRPGEEAQVDFFEMLVDLGGLRRKAWKFLMRLMYSGRDYVRLYDRCDQIALLDGHVRAFAYFGGVPWRLIYDNLTGAVKCLVGLKERKLTAAFKALCSHYLFEACFTRRGEGHDKGGVENRGKIIRLQHLTPILAGKDLEEISAQALSEIEREWSGKTNKEGRALRDLFEAEKSRLHSLPAKPFEARRMEPVAISHSSTVQVEGATYSLPSGWARLDATAWIGPTDISFVCRDETATRPRQARGQRLIYYRDYLKELSRKPQAVRQVAPELVAELGATYGRIWELLVKTHGELQGARHLAGILGAICEHGEGVITQALNEALERGRCDLLPLQRYLSAQQVTLDSTRVPEGLRGVEVEAVPAAEYNELLAGGVQ